jgi:cell pole-organizing protein PopZ
MHHQGEASVEEILESIKKVIARDNRASALETRRRREEAGVAGAGSATQDSRQDDEVLDLGAASFVEEARADQVRADGARADGARADGARADGGDSGDDDGDSPLTTDAVRDSLRENLAALAMLAEPGAPPQIVRSGETSLEGLVRDMLRPMLAEWLDRNLPPMVERLVKAEIARIAGKRG